MEQPKNCKELIELVKQQKSTLIYGTGWIAKDCYRFLNAQIKDFAYAGFLTGKRRVREKQLYGQAVQKPEEIKETERDSLVLIAELPVLCESAEKKLARQGFTNVICLTQELVGELTVLLKYIPLLKLRFEVQLVEHCNLGCMGCDHFSPLAKEEFVSYESLESDFKRISELMNQDVERIQLLGGEPLLHPDINRILAMTRSYFPNAMLLIVTNGIRLLSMDEEFWQMCRENHIYIGVTKYPIALDFEQMEAKAQEEEVNYYYFDGEDVVKTLWHIQIDETGEQKPQENYQKCWRINRCILLAKGKLYPCVIPPNIRHFNAAFGTQLHVCEEDSIDIYQAKDSQEIFDFLCRPFPFCRYCNIAGETTGHPWQVSKKVKTEWT